MPRKPLPHRREYTPSGAEQTTICSQFHRNPEDCLPIATTTNNTHARHVSQPESAARNASPPQQEDPVYPVPQTGNMPSVSENLDPNDQVGPQPPSPSTRASQSPPHSSTVPSFHRPLPSAARPRGATRTMSKGGGVQMVLGEAGSWSDLADHSSTLPAEGMEGTAAKGKGSNSGMLSFLSRKKGRDRSPKPTEPGVLGKEGARQIIS